MAKHKLQGQDLKDHLIWMVQAAQHDQVKMEFKGGFDLIPWLNEGFKTNPKPQLHVVLIGENMVNYYPTTNKTYFAGNDNYETVTCTGFMNAIDLAISYYWENN